MSEIRDHYDAVKLHRKRQAEKRYGEADEIFRSARAMAQKHNLILKRCDSTHYQLSNGEWLINLYPGNLRVYADRNRARAPFLSLPGEWTLVDVVISATGQKSEACMFCDRWKDECQCEEKP